MLAFLEHWEKAKHKWEKRERGYCCCSCPCQNTYIQLWDLWLATGAPGCAFTTLRAWLVRHQTKATDQRMPINMEDFKNAGLLAHPSLWFVLLVYCIYLYVLLGPDSWIWIVGESLEQSDSGGVKPDPEDPQIPLQRRLDHFQRWVLQLCIELVEDRSCAPLHQTDWEKRLY